MSERVLCVKRELIHKYIDGKYGLITAGCEEILNIITENHVFLPRPEAEMDPSYKQVIPYVALLRGNEVYVLRRLKKGGETRLHDKLSLGVGGHINPADDERSAALMNGLRREVDEEVAIEREISMTPRGVINDDGTEVGSVHLGFYFTMEVEGEVSVRETEKLSGQWVKLTELTKYREQMETWSQIAMEVL